MASAEVVHLRAELEAVKAELDTEKKRVKELEMENEALKLRVKELSVGHGATEADESKENATGAADAGSPLAEATEEDTQADSDDDDYDEEVTPEKSFGTSIIRSKPAIPLVSQFMNERRRWMIRTIMLMRFTIRGYFGMSFSNKWGFFIDRHMSAQIHAYSDWIDYEKGNLELDGHDDSVTSIAISKDGHFLYSGSLSGSVIVWNMVMDNSMIRKWKAHKGIINAMIQKSGILVTVSGDYSAKVWRGYDYQLLHHLEGHTQYVSSVDISHEMKIIVTGSSDNTIRVWSMDDGHCLGKLTGHRNTVVFAQFMGGDVLLTGSLNARMKVWMKVSETKDESCADKCRRTVYDRNRDVITDMSVSKDRSRVACFCGNELSILEWPSLEVILTDYHRYCFKGDFHPYNHDLIAMDDRNEKSLDVFSVSKNQVIRSFSNGELNNIRSVRFTPNGQRLISVSQSEEIIRIWDTSDLCCLE